MYGGLTPFNKGNPDAYDSCDSRWCSRPGRFRGVGECRAKAIEIVQLAFGLMYDVEAVAEEIGDLVVLVRLDRLDEGDEVGLEQAESVPEHLAPPARAQMSISPGIHTRTPRFT